MVVIAEEIISGPEVYRLVGRTITRVLENGEHIVLKSYENEEEAAKRFENLKDLIGDKDENIIIL